MVSSHGETQLTAESNPSGRAGELGIPARVVVGLLLVVGLLVAAPTGLGLFWYVPFAGISALLVVRRPRMSIGWIMFALAWAFVITTTSVDATPQQFAAGRVSSMTAVLAVASACAGVSLFYLFAVLAILFPSGRLPVGRWHATTRLAVWLGAVLCAFEVVLPVIGTNLRGADAQVFVRNPFALLPDLPIWQVVTADNVSLSIILLMAASVISLFVRFRHASGVDRQQLRWLAAALVFVVTAVVGGFLVGQLAPQIAESGDIWLGAVVAFPCVPIAVGIAVLRYRLYQIDTIINRAIVYGLLTAILTGGSAAAIALFQRVFVGALGPGSDVTVILTTLIVVTAFNPIKSRLQTLVDRRFKEMHSPADVMGVFAEEVRRSISPPDLDRTLRRFLEVAVAAYRATGGEVRVQREGEEDRTSEVGSQAGEPGPRASVSSGTGQVVIVLHGGDSSRDAQALQENLAKVLEESAAGFRQAASLARNESERSLPLAGARTPAL